MSALVEARDLRKRLGGVLAVDGLSLQVEAGEIYALMGPDGAGKSTAIRLLCGAMRPDEGEVILGGVSLGRQPESARSLLGYFPQGFCLYDDLTVAENLRFFAEVRGLPGQGRRERIEQALRFVGLEAFAHYRAGALSGGMKQKLGLAVAVIHRPRILLLDEPTRGVDPLTRQAFWRLITSLLRERVAILVSTPYMDEAARCTRVGFMRAGRLLVEGSPQGLSHMLKGRVLEVFGGPLRPLASLARQLPEVESAQPFGDRLRLRIAAGAGEGVARHLRQLAKETEAHIESITQAEPTLDDVFTQLLEQGS